MRQPIIFSVATRHYGPVEGPNIQLDAAKSAGVGVVISISSVRQPATAWSAILTNSATRSNRASVRDSNSAADRPRKTPEIIGLKIPYSRIEVQSCREKGPGERATATDRAFRGPKVWQQHTANPALLAAAADRIENTSQQGLAEGAGFEHVVRSEISASIR